MRENTCLYYSAPARGLQGVPGGGGGSARLCAAEERKETLELYGFRGSSVHARLGGRLRWAGLRSKLCTYNRGGVCIK